jgi:transposase
VTKFSYEERFETVRKILEEHKTYQAAAKELGGSKEIIRRWVNSYRAHGIEGLFPQNIKYTGEFKIKVVEYMYANGLSADKTALMYKIPADATVKAWARVYNEEGAQGLLRSRLMQADYVMDIKPEKSKSINQAEEELITENRRLRMENAYLKKLQALVQERIQRESGKK